MYWHSGGYHNDEGVFATFRTEMHGLLGIDLDFYGRPRGCHIVISRARSSPSLGEGEFPELGTACPTTTLFLHLQWPAFERASERVAISGRLGIAPGYEAAAIVHLYRSHHRLGSYLRAYSIRRLSAAEWVLYFKNTGHKPSPILQDVHALNIRFQSEGSQFVLHRALGSNGQPTDFAPVDQTLEPGRQVLLAPVGGRSSNTNALPFFNIEAPAAGSCRESGADTPLQGRSSAVKA